MDKSQGKVPERLCTALLSSVDMKFLLWSLLVITSSLSSCLGSESNILCLRTLQKSLIDPNGILKSSWNFDDGVNGHICGFTAVECRHADENKVMGMRLGNLGLGCQFPKGLQDCSSLTWLDLSSNNFSGPIPSDIARQVPYLTFLDLSYNSFSGEIPIDISNMAYLNVLNLQHNQLSGRIPEQFSVLPRLTSFYVSDNSLSGPIPWSLEKFPASNFAGNRGLCGSPLDDCPSTRQWRTIRGLHRINNESSIGAAAGFVLGFVVTLYLTSCTASYQLHPNVFHV